MRMLNCLARSPLSFSKRLPGGICKSSSFPAASSIANFRLVTLAAGDPLVLPVRQILSVSELAKLLITQGIITNTVNNVNRYYQGDILEKTKSGHDLAGYCLG